MAELFVSLVAMDRPVWRGDARIVVATTPEGEIGIMAGHEPVLALLVESSALRLEEPDGSRLVVAVHGGFFSVAGNDVNVIAEVAELAEDIDLERAQAALARIQADGQVTEEEQAALARAETRIQVAGIAKGVASR